ncbi:MAG: NADH-quinone oxidoreductase subunit NuoK [Planctomycetota bacterium]|nr:MAG: NADH-quinone oxidoreductase subunit NuoK [Planctomycetota bacterium]
MSFAALALAQESASDAAATVPASVPVEYYLFVSIFLFLIGLTVILTRRNLIYVLMGIELILNSASLNFVAFGSHRGEIGLVDGSLFGLFIIVLAAAEAVIALAIVLNVFGLFASVRTEDPNLLRE